MRIELDCRVSRREEDDDGCDVHIFLGGEPRVDMGLEGVSEEQFNALRPGVRVKVTLEVEE